MVAVMMADSVTVRLVAMCIILHTCTCIILVGRCNWS